jgi:hypothetical protein
MKRVLLVSAVFPPQLGGASEKMAKRVKYFSRFGWHTTVLVPAIPPDSSSDRTLLKEIENANVEIHRTKYFFQAQWPSLRHDKNRIKEFYGSKLERILDMLFVPKGFVRWLPFALHTGKRLASSVDVILTMNNPITLHFIGYILHKLTGKPWVAEIRDPIVKYAYGRRGPEKLNYWLESLIINNAKVVIQREDGTPDSISCRYPDLPASKFVVIPYAGFDPDDFVLQEIKKPKEFSDETLVISYTGSLYGNTITPAPLLRGLRRFLSVTNIPPGSLCVVFAGDWDTRYDQTIQDLGLQEIVEYRGRLTRPECIDLWWRSQVLLLILGKEEDNLLRVPSKFWDYLGAGRSMLALVHPEGRVANLVYEQQLGFVADPENEDDIVSILERIWQAHQQGTLKPKPSPLFLSQATRANSEKMVIDVFNQIIVAAQT